MSCTSLMWSRRDIALPVSDRLPSSQLTNQGLSDYSLPLHLSTSTLFWGLSNQTLTCLVVFFIVHSIYRCHPSSPPIVLTFLKWVLLLPTIFPAKCTHTHSHRVGGERESISIECEGSLIKKSDYLPTQCGSVIYSRTVLETCSFH